MPKGDTVTFEIEPRAVLDAADWLLNRDPYRAENQSLLIASLSPETREAYEAEHWERVNEAIPLLLGWLQRRNRYATPDKKMNICLPRSVVKWLAGFDRPRIPRGGIFGASVRPSARSVSMRGPAEVFFFRCLVATSRRMGRPRLTPDQAAKRLAAHAEMADSTMWRLTARSSGNDQSRLASLMAQIAKAKTPDL